MTATTLIHPARLTLLVSVFTLFGLTGCKDNQDHPSDPTIPVQVKAVEQGTVPETHHYSADLQPVQMATLRFRVNGYVAALRPVRDPVTGQLRRLDIGDSVPQGGVLASLRRIDFTTGVDGAHAATEESRHTAQSTADQLRQNEAQLANDQANHTRAQRLYAAGAMTGRDFDRSKAQYESSLASRDSTVKQLAANQDDTRQSEAQETSKRLDLNDSDLRAPFPGVVLAKSVEVGDYASNMQDAFRFGNISFVKAVFYVPAIEVAQLHLGDEVDVHLQQNGGAPARGRINLISTVADRQSRLFTVDVLIPNAEHKLLVGATGALDLKTGLNLQKLSVPLTALVAANGDTQGYTVFVLQRNGDKTIVKLRRVYLIAVAADRAVISGDLQPDEKVVDRPSEQLRDGSLVVVRDGESL